MSVIGNPAAVPNRIEILCRYLSNCGGNGATFEELSAVLSPKALTDAVGGATLAPDVIREAVRLGIIVSGPDDRYLPALELRDLTDSTILEWLEAILLDPVRATAAGQSGFPVALAWLLEQDPAEPFDFGANITDRVAQQCGPSVNAFGITNRVRLQNFVYWAQYLGFAWRLRVGELEFIMPDPTRAMERHLPQIFGKGPELLMRDLIQEWATRIPVLEGGSARIELAELCEKAFDRDPTVLSRSTTVGLLRLEGRGMMRLERRADAPTFTLSCRPNIRVVSHAVWL